MSSPVARILLAVCLGVFALRSWSSLRQESATWDETHYLGLGRYLAETARWDVPGSILHPPLSYYLHSLPLLSVETAEGPWQGDPRRATDPDYLGAADIARGVALLSSTANHDDRLLAASRLMMVLTALLLGVCVYAWSAALYGPWSAVAAAVLVTCCPNILAHARLITPDIAVTTFGFISCYFLWRFLREERRRHAVGAGLGLGLTLLSKFSGALLVPIVLGLMGLWWVRSRRLDLAGCLLVFVLGLAVLWLGYGLDLEPYLEGIAYQRAHAVAGHDVFLLGEYSKAGWWYYFLVSLLIKTPIGALALIAVGLAVFVAGLRKREGLDEAFLLVPAVVVVGFFSFQHQSIGLRYVLPALPFLFVLASRAVRVAAARGRWAVGLVALLLAWHAGASWSIHPHYLAYFNELVGGSRNGYRCLVDSNLDWGQDLKGLKRYMDAHGITKVHLSYFGSDSPARYGIDYAWMPSVVLPKPASDPVPLKRGDWVAISATNLAGVYFDDKQLFAEFREREPVATIGYSIFLYRL